MGILRLIGNSLGLKIGLVAGLVAVWAAPAQAYIGPSFVKIPGVQGDWQGKDYRNWVRIESNYWNEKPPRGAPLYRGKPRTFYSGPAAPRTGPGQLALALAKDNPAYAKVMALCASNSVVPEIAYAESSSRARPPAELGERPPSIPAWFEYTLKDVRIGCPEVSGAPEQAVILRFGDIVWRNYDGAGAEALAPPAELPPSQQAGATRAFIVHRLTSANDISPDQCAVLAQGPSEADYYALMSPDMAAEERAKHAKAGGILAKFGAMAARGPEQLYVPLLPGLVPDPGLPAPQIDVARGFDLDGKQRPNGKGAQRKAYSLADGTAGIDNQLFTVDGCVKGWGPLGILTVTTTESRRNGEISWMILVSGIDDEQQDDHVDVTLFYSKDPMVKSATGKNILPGYTFRVTDDVQRMAYFQRVKGRIVDGVVLTEPADEIKIDRGRDDTRLINGRLRLEMRPDRTLDGVVGGYLDWRSLAHNAGVNTFLEVGLGYSVAAVYNAFKRAADGLPDPVTGEMTAVSAAFDIHGVEAYLPPEEERALLSAGTVYAQRAPVHRSASSAR